MRKLHSTLAIVGAASVMAVGAIALTAGDDEQRVSQDATAEAEGLQVEAVDAQFSGTATIVTLAVRSSDGSELPGAAIRLGELRLSGFEQGDWAARHSQDGRLQLRLPPITVAAAESPSIEILTLEIVSEDGANTPTPGPWPLGLALPASGTLGELMRTEHLAGVSAGPVRDVRATRSVTETIVTSSVDGAIASNSSATLVSGELRLTPLAFEANDGKLTAIFPATAFGSALSLQIDGLRNLPADSTPDLLELPLGDWLAETNQDLELGVAFEAADLQSPHPYFVSLETVAGRPGDDNYSIRIRMKGLYYSEIREPVVLGASGERLPLRAVGVYQQGQDGNEPAGETAFDFWASSGADLSRVTLEVAPASDPLPAVEIELRP